MRHWSDDFNTYADACRFYGCDTPADLAYEAECEAAAYLNAKLDEIEVGGPTPQPEVEIPW